MSNELWAIYGPDGNMRTLWLSASSAREAWKNFASYYSDSKSGIDFVIDGLIVRGYTCHKVTVRKVEE